MAWVAVGVMLLVPVGVGPSATHLPAAASGETCLVGAGTTGDPFLVGNADDLAKVGSGTNGCTLGASYLQTADIALAAPAAGDSNHVPIGREGGQFTGVYDGDGFTIDGPVIARAGESGMGFFSGAFGATIRDVHITGGSITGEGVIGGLISAAVDSMVSGSSFSGTVTADNRDVGGLIGVAIYSTVLRSFSQGTVTGGSSVGGLIGNAQNSDVRTSFSTADVNGTGDRIGGLIGIFRGRPDVSAAGRHVTDSFARGDVTSSTGAAVGGVIGEVSDATIARVFATGAVSASGTATDVGGLVGQVDSTSFTGSFWDTQTSGQATSAAGTGRTTGQLTSHATFTDTATEGLTTTWPIVAGWAPYEDGTTVWGICTGVNDGYPFLLWQFDTDPCSAPAGADSSSLALSCEGTRAAGTKVTCTVTGGDAGIDILWRAAYNPTFAEAGVTLDASGAGTFSFVVPAAAFGQPITVELVDWTAPMTLGVVGGPVPASVPAGEGSVPFGAVLLALLASAGVVVAGRRLVTAG